MPTQLVPDGVEVVFKALQNNVPIVNIYNVKYTGTIDVAALTDIVNLFEAWWIAQIQPVISNSYVLESITATNMESGVGPQVSESYSSGHQGTLTGEQVAGNAALVISWRTANIGRSFRGRTYIGGLDAAATDTAQNVSASFASAMAAAGADLIDRLQAFGAALAVLSRYAAGVLRVVGLLTEIIGVVVDTKIDSQRRRTAN